MTVETREFGSQVCPRPDLPGLNRLHIPSKSVLIKSDFERRFAPIVAIFGQAGGWVKGGADVWILTPTVVRFLGRVQIILVTSGGLLPGHLSVAFRRLREMKRRQQKHYPQAVFGGNGIAPLSLP